MSQQTNRRVFLLGGVGLTVAAGGARGLGRSAKAARRAAKGISANGKLQHASIGVGGMGWGDVRQFGSHKAVEIAAVCDIDTKRSAPAAKLFPHARRYQDWRELLDKEGDKIDTVNVATPDHMHAPIAMSAMNLGKPVYCQKPLAHDVHEARRLAEAAAKGKLATQMGIQINASIGYRMAVQMIRSGAIGQVKRVYAWSNKPAGKYRPTGPRPAGKDAVPATLDWDGWLGTAPVRPFRTGVYHPTWWRGWQDFGTGWLGDMGCHIVDTPYQALKLTAPLRVRAEVEGAWAKNPARCGETWPTWQVVHFVFPGTDLTAGKTLEFTWSDGGKFPPRALRAQIDGQKYPSQGSLMLGETGALLLPHVGGPQLLPKAKYKGYARPKLAPRNHYHHWVDACLGKAKTNAGFDYSGPLTEVILLGTVALRCAGRDLAWDAAKMQVTNHANANQYLRRTYRRGWDVKGL